MPNDHPQANNQKKKKKGHAPAYQNKFAFRHNPKSKRTDTILALPILHVCRRCNDKLEWRKQYRKYKPRTKIARKCNLCQKKNIYAAYHTICDTCTKSSPKALEVLAQLNKGRDTQEHHHQQEGEEEKEEIHEENITSDIVEEDDPTKENEEQASTEEQELPHEEESLQQQEQPPPSYDDTHNDNGERLYYTRICAICVKEPALGNTSTTPPGTILPEKSDTGGRLLKLREIKSLERQKERDRTASKRNKNARRKKRAEEQEGGDHDDGESNSEDDEDDHSEEDDNSDDDDEAEQEEEDEFLKAVGGKDKLLVGEAFQAQKILEAKAQEEAAAEQVKQLCLDADE